MDDLIVAHVGGQAFAVGNGRQVARRRDGVWFLAYDDGVEGSGSVVLSPSREPAPLTEKAFCEPVVLAGDGKSAVLSGLVPGGADQISVLVDGTDRLHAVWRGPEAGDLWYAQCDVSGSDYDARLRDPGSWLCADGSSQGPERVSAPDLGAASLGDIALDGRGRIWVAYSQGLESHSVYLAVSDDEWQRRSFAMGWDSRAPTLDVEGDGTLHIVFGPGPDYKIADWSEDPFGVLERTGVYHAQSADGGESWTHADGETPGAERVGISGGRPQVLASKGRIWVAYSAGGSWEPVERRHFREGPTLHYSYYDGQEWQSNIYCAAQDPDLSVSPRHFIDS